MLLGEINSTIEENLFSELEGFFYDSKVGFEKESLRVSHSNISKKIHPNSLGSALCNNFITTDFSEAQLELVTLPYNDKLKGLYFLEDLHHFISCNIDDEIIWPFSMPPVIEKDEDVPIASYGLSNLGLFKKLYREGLSHRYSRQMQAISGMHFNYSVSESFWNSQLLFLDGNSPSDIRSAAYFNMLRNIHRVNWLILYLFGASPIITKNFISNNSQELKKIDNQTFYLQYATSLRMSEFGYCNNTRNKLHVSMNSLREYVSDLDKATNTVFSEYLKIDEPKSDKSKQINSNLLQIDDEYYAIARAKSNLISEQSTTSKLRQNGVDYIELRSLDLNPYSRVGIDKETTFFIEVLLNYCFIKQEQHFTEDELKSINHNDSLVALSGRKPNLYLSQDGKAITLKDWGKQIMESLLPIASAMDSNEKNYTNAVEQMREKINYSEITLSAKLLDEILSSNQSFVEFGSYIGESNKAHYLKIERSKNINWDLIEKESEESNKRQIKLETADTKSFESFIKDYTNQ
jgi:glutamate--cysteine ligase